MNRDEYLKIIIREKYSEKKTYNSSYSQRSHARDIGLSPSGYNQFLAGKRNLSDKLINRVLNGLKLKESEQKRYLSLPTAKEDRKQEKIEFIIDHDLFKLKVRLKVISQDEEVIRRIVDTVGQISDSIEKNLKAKI